MARFEIPGKLPEINAVANAIMALVQSEEQDIDETRATIQSVTDELMLYCKFVKEFETKPLFWHEFKANRGIK